MEGEEGKDGTGQVPDETVGRERGRAVEGPVHVDEIDGAGVEDAEIAPRKRHGREDRTDPTDVLPRRPREPEQADRQAEAPQHCRVQAMLRRDGAASAIFAAPEIFFVIPQSVDEHRRRGSRAATEADAQECETGEAGVEVVDFAEDEGEGIEESEEDGEIEAGVQA